MVIGIRPEKLPEYQELHADDHPGVRDLLSAAHMRNFSIYLQKFPDGNHYLFGYYEHDGDDYEGGHGTPGGRAAQPAVACHLRRDADSVPGRANLETDEARLLPGLSWEAPTQLLPRHALWSHRPLDMVVHTCDYCNHRFRADFKVPVSCAPLSGESLAEFRVSMRCVGTERGQEARAKTMGGTALSSLASLT